MRAELLAGLVNKIALWEFFSGVFFYEGAVISVGDIVLSACDSLEKPEHLSAKIRYNQKEQPATVIQTDKDKLKIIFDEPQRAVTKGQAAVVYDGDTVIGGGTIL